MSQSAFINKLERFIGILDASIVLKKIPLGEACSLQPESRVLVISVAVLEIKVDGLPNSYMLNSFNAWASPRVYARKYFFDTFGSNCLVEIVGHSVKDTKLTQNAVRRDKIVTVVCRTLWKQISAVMQIARFVRHKCNRNESNSKGPMFFNKLQTDRDKDQGITHKYSVFEKTIISKYLSTYQFNHGVPRAVLMCGFPGSGKNWVLKRRPRVDHVLIDVDLCLEYMPEFWSGVASNTNKSEKDWVFSLRDQARDIANLMLDTVISNKMHFIWNGTGRSLDFYTELIQRLRYHGYIIEICGIFARTATARQRMRTRVRPVPKCILMDAMNSVAPNFKQLADIADHARVWSNDQEVENGPSIIWDKYYGVLDTNAWRIWESPSPLPVSPRGLNTRSVEWSNTAKQTLPPIQIPPKDVVTYSKSI